MKTWEMIKEVMENPKKRFVCHPHKPEVGYHDSFLVWFDGSYTKFHIIRPDEEWTEVKQPVTWQEALEAWAFNGKDISCEIGGCKYIYTRSNNIKDWLIDSADNGISNRRMTLGTWYIEN